MEETGNDETGCPAPRAVPRHQDASSEAHPRGGGSSLLCAISPPLRRLPLLNSHHTLVSLIWSHSSAEVSSPSHGPLHLPEPKPISCSTSLPAISRGTCCLLRSEVAIIPAPQCNRQTPSTIVPQDKPPLTLYLPVSSVALLQAHSLSLLQPLAPALVTLRARGSFFLVPLPLLLFSEVESDSFVTP